MILIIHCLFVCVGKYIKWEWSNLIIHIIVSSRAEVLKNEITERNEKKEKEEQKKKARVDPDNNNAKTEDTKV